MEEERKDQEVNSFTVFMSENFPFYKIPCAFFPQILYKIYWPQPYKQI